MLFVEEIITLFESEKYDFTQELVTLSVISLTCHIKPLQLWENKQTFYSM